MVPSGPLDVELLLRDGAWLTRFARALIADDGTEELFEPVHIQALRQLLIPTESTDDAFARAELRLIVVNTVIDLAEPFRSAVLLRFFEALSIAAIGRLTRTPIDTVRARVRDGIARAREALEATIGRHQDR